MDALLTAARLDGKYQFQQARTRLIGRGRQ
jgi:hypothetical protein